ncbi:MAG TPA: hypothetical protein PLA68_18645, partial [Panacibacter sp.]|nr:hypothetical protein [Panacibacter sp.]
ALAIAQTKKGDSLNWFIQTAKTDEEKIQAIINYTDEYFNISKDSLDKYTHIAIELAGKTKNEILKSEAQLMLANNFVQMGWTDSAYNAADAGLKKLNVNNIEQRSLYFRMSRAKAVALGGEGRLEESLDVLYKILPDAEKYKDSLEASIICNTLSFIANARNELPEGIKWNDKALQYAQNLKPGRIGSAYVSRANLYNKLNKKDSALYFVNTAIELLERDEFLDRLVSAYRLKSAVLSGMNKLPEAEKALMNMIEYRRKLNQQQGFVVEDNLQIADFYASTGQLNRAIELCKFYLQRGDETKQRDTSVTFNNDVATRLPYYTALAGYLKDAGDTKAYIDALENIVALKDSVYELNNAQAIAEMQTKYNVQEKEKTILAQELQLTRHNILLFGSL